MENNKQRVIGVMVLVSLAIIFLPSLFHREQQRVKVDTATLIPPQPEVKPIVVTPPKKLENIQPAPTPDKIFQPALKSEPATGQANVDQEQPLRLNAEGLPDAWVVQAGSFKSEKLAKELKKKLLESDFKAYSRPVTTSKGQFFRVFTGPYIEKRRAQEIKVKVDKQYRLKSQIVRFSAE